MAEDPRATSFRSVAEFLIKDRLGRDPRPGEIDDLTAKYVASGYDNSVAESFFEGDVSGEGNPDVDPGDTAFQQGETVSTTGMNLYPTGETGLTTTQAALQALEGTGDPGMSAGPGSSAGDLFLNTLDTVQGTTNPPVNYSPLITQYYQELFNRDPQQAGIDYFTGRLGSGALTEEGLRDAMIAGAQGVDRMYYDASQSGGPVFDATQALFGRRPARGRFNPETGQLEGGYGAYRSRLDAGELTPEQLRGRLVQSAYRRGEGGGQSADYQAYLDSLGIDRSGNPFLQDGGTYANVAYGSDLSQYQPDPGMPAPPGGGDVPLPGEETPFPMPGPTPSPMPPRMPGKGGRIPGQYITGNQLYSGLPYGMTQPMGMMNFMQPMMQPAIYQPPQLSQQYMPNRGLMSGYSTGFGPYGGYRRPRFGGGKGGPRIQPYPYPMGGGKGGFGY